MRVTSGIPLGSPLALIVVIMNSAETLKAHLFRMWHACLPVYTDLRSALGSAHDIAGVLAVCADLKQRLMAAEAANANPIAEKQHHAWSGAVPVFEQDFALEDAIGFHACSLEALASV